MSSSTGSNKCQVKTSNGRCRRQARYTIDHVKYCRCHGQRKRAGHDFDIVYWGEDKKKLTPYELNKKLSGE